MVLATHSDISLSLLGAGATPDEHRVLSAIPYNNNDIYLHTDEALMPVSVAAVAAFAMWQALQSVGVSSCKMLPPLTCHVPAPRCAWPVIATVHPT